MAVVSISRQFGAGGKTLGERLAKSLGYQFVDRQLIRQVAKEANVSVDWVVAIERGTSDKLVNFVSSLVRPNFMERLLQNSASDFNEDKYIEFIKKVQLQLAEEGDIVILGRGSQFILPSDPNIYKILMVADYPDRIKFLAEQYGITRAEAEELVRREGKKRDAFLSKLDPRSPDDASLYHLCLNTSLIGLNQAEKMVLDMMQRPGGSGEL